MFNFEQHVIDSGDQHIVKVYKSASAQDLRDFFVEQHSSRELAEMPGYANTAFVVVPVVGYMIHDFNRPQEQRSLFSSPEEVELYIATEPKCKIASILQFINGVYLGDVLKEIRGRDQLPIEVLHLLLSRVANALVFFQMSPTPSQVAFRQAAAYEELIDSTFDSLDREYGELPNHKVERDFKAGLLELGQALSRLPRCFFLDFSPTNVMLDPLGVAAACGVGVNSSSPIEEVRCWLDSFEKNPIDPTVSTLIRSLFSNQIVVDFGSISKYRIFTEDVAFFGHYLGVHFDPRAKKLWLKHYLDELGRVGAGWASSQIDCRRAILLGSFFRAARSAAHIAEGRLLGGGAASHVDVILMLSECASDLQELADQGSILPEKTISRLRDGLGHYLRQVENRLLNGEDPRKAELSFGRLRNGLSHWSMGRSLRGTWF